MKWIRIISCIFLFSPILELFSQNTTNDIEQVSLESAPVLRETTVIVLGNVQDAGSPHIGCKKKCCEELFIRPDVDRKVVSLGLIDPKQKKKFIIDATPDITEQLRLLAGYLPENQKDVPDGIFLTHAHIGHYAGLMYFGREALGSKGTRVFAMPKMKSFLTTNAPWSQLISLENIELKDLQHNHQVVLTPTLKVIPFLVPHRDEFSETVGYRIIGPKKSALFIPDIDKWHKWEGDIIEEIRKVDYAFLDASFFSAEEIDHRDISEIPHPTVLESMALFKDLHPIEKNKIWFIHMNHTNPMLDSNSAASKKVLDNGFRIARIRDRFSL